MSAYEPADALATVNDDQVIWKIRTTHATQAGKVAPWVLTVARYRAIDIARSNRQHVAHRASDGILHTVRAPSSVVEQVVARAQARDLRSRLALLPDAQREVITLAFYGQLTHGEIAAHLGLSPGTVKGRMRVGLQRLRGDFDCVAT
ncbi:MAG: sigma-70 family RNA polymerase sigma factor [Solirubrobacteraceae bacterium]